jgi:glutaredoxin 3
MAETADQPQPRVEIYTNPLCGFCYMAKRLLRSKGIEFAEIDVLMAPDKRREMAQRAGGRTSVPQVFIDGHHIGGSEALRALDASGALDRLLERV